MRFLTWEIVLVFLWVLAGCGYSPEEDWIMKNYRRCSAMGGHYFYDKDTKEFECYRHPIGRMTKTMFKDKYVRKD